MLTCSLFITYHRFIIVIDTMQPLVYYRLNSAVLVYTPLITPPLAVYMLGVLHKNWGVITPLGVWINP